MTTRSLRSLLVRSWRTLPESVRGHRFVYVMRVLPDRIQCVLSLRHVARRVRCLSDSTGRVTAAEGLTVLCLVRNGEEYIRDFVEHYRRLGVARIIFLDNGSADRTIDIACSAPGVAVYSCNAEFARYGVAMKQHLIAVFGSRNWTLVADIDEFFDYPLSNRVPIDLFLRYLDRYRFDSVIVHMLDIFSMRPARAAAKSEKSTSLRRTYDSYDLSGLRNLQSGHDPLRHLSRRRRRPKIPFFTGGIRLVSFESNCWLTKHALFHGARVRACDYHEHAFRHGRLADFSCVFYHYLFTTRFPQKCVDAVAGGVHHDNSVEYRKYLACLPGADRPDGLKLKHPKRLRSVDQLVGEGFLHVSDRYRRFAEAITR